ncbi:LA2681 family HEPN domain-containing protein [Reyranella sp.]|uniref:LA2681 family HEPN domain-containing protein n=1 Tax=Reyranella sp. TaxID=1929291 RepID=UPI003BABF7A0
MVKADRLKRLRDRSITKLGDEAALDHIGALIDASLDAGFAPGADRAINLLNELEKRQPSAKLCARLDYFRANAWYSKEVAVGARGSWAWEHPEREQQILALSRAVAHPGFADLDVGRRCQILTNRANQLNVMGRFIDAIEGWDAALRTVPKFAMALANRGYGLKRYGGLLDDDRERAILLLHAHDGLVAATGADAVHDSPHPYALIQRFAEDAKALASAGDLNRIRELLDLGMPRLGRSKAERKYRRWCLDERLFLNSLNDLGPHARAASDDLVLPPITERLDERPGLVTPPPVIGFFNQMKQEYVSARFMLYEGLQDTKQHFSDRGVRMFNTLDYPMHSLATERVRAAYRIAYSLLDKVAFLVDHYWKLGKVTDRINFKNVWMVEGKSRLHDRFMDYSNWPLRGLFWLSKELFDDQLKLTTGPDARELHEIRNALEHKFLQVHEGWAWSLGRPLPSGEGLSFLIDSDLLERKALRVMKMARSALIQLILAIGVEERARRREQPDTVIANMPLFGLDDRRKRRDPL